MLSVNTYTQDYIDACRNKINQQLSSYKILNQAVQQESSKNKAALQTALQDFDLHFFNHMVLALEQYFCHRSRNLERKDGNPLNEVRMLSQSIMNNRNILWPDKTINYDSARSILKLKMGDEISLSETGFTNLSRAYFSEMERKFLPVDKNKN